MIRTACAMLCVLAVATGACSSEKPATPADGATVVEVTITAEGCLPDPIVAPAGSVGFSVTNDGASAVSEFEVLGDDDRILGEVENVASGLTRDFSMTLAAGEYVTYCPGAARERGVLTVTAGG